MRSAVSKMSLGSHAPKSNVAHRPTIPISQTNTAIPHFIKPFKRPLTESPRPTFEQTHSAKLSIPGHPDPIPLSTKTTSSPQPGYARQANQPNLPITKLRLTPTDKPPHRPGYAQLHSAKDRHKARSSLKLDPWR